MKSRRQRGTTIPLPIQPGPIRIYEQFIEKWKRATAHVFFNAGPHIFYLAGPGVAARLGGPFQRGEFALCALTRDDFLRAVRWEDSASSNPPVN